MDETRAQLDDAALRIRGVLRHLPGKHDQSAHGRKGPKGAAKAAAKKVAAGISVGVDRLAEIKAAAADIRSKNPRGDRFDTELAEIARRQGFDGKPRVATAAQVDDAVAGGWTEIWRGVKDYDAGNTAADINERYRSGQFQPGKSSGYGGGVYTSVDRAVAEAYRGAELKFDKDYNVIGYSGGTEDGILRLALNPKARVADYDDMVDQHKAAVAEMDGDEKAVLGDLGRWLAAQGYDAIRVHGHGDGFSLTDPPDQYVILNRTATMVEVKP